MNANELMIGDIVMYCPNGSRWYVRLSSITKNMCRTDENSLVRIENLKPIPLTREMLELNGFKMRERFQYSEDEWIESFVNLECTFKVQFSDKDGFLWNGCDIKYIHDLQHALRIAGLKKLADNFKI